MLERMDAFFAARLDTYESHMLQGIEGAEEFYPFTAACLPETPGAEVLDLGCGTGLELQWYFARNPQARVTGIDLSEAMLNRLREKFPDRSLNLLQGSYFELPLGEARFDGAVSVESLHHFPQEQKTALYHKLYRALKPGGAFILTDYFADDEREEEFFFRELARLREEQGITDGEFYHYDTPLTLEHEIRALKNAGFDTVEELAAWGKTHILRAKRKNT